MYEQDVIFGPFSVKQFVTLIVGLVLSRLLYNQLPKYESLQIYIYITIAFIIGISLYISFSIFRNKEIPIAQLEEYFKNIKIKMPKEQYTRMIFRKMTEVGSQIQMRKEKGLLIDESLNKVYNILLAEYDIINLEHTKNNP